SLMVRSSFVLAWNEGASQKFNHATIEAALQEAGTSWMVRLNKVFLTYGYHEDAAAELSLRYGRAFADSYQERYQVRQSVHDIQKIEQVLVSQSADVDFYKPYNAENQEVSLKIFSPVNPIHLSNVLPILENMGLSIIAEYPFEVTPRDSGHSIWIQDFQAAIASSTGQKAIEFDKAKIAAISEQFESCLKGVWAKQIENDSLNKLIILAGMPWRDVVILRSYVRYLRQTKIPFSLPYMEKALTDHPEIALLLTQYFHVVLNPALQGKKGVSAGAIEKQILESLQKVSLLDQDRVLRAVFALVRVTLRTNFYQVDKNGHPNAAVSIKLDSAQINDIPDPKPFREIFVYSPRVEGIHLRCGPISRGGLRWSDRHEDFRTEVLGLMKAQQVKNSVIVPQGSKGGFVVKLPPVDGGREAYQKEGIACYQIYIRALLDITDNRKGGKVVPPLNVVRLDQDDPYLVVAADKGTATFSDIANAISVERGFWLGDAFASGGSAGYDHKKMGITARGSWESVKRHFRELNHNTQTDVFDVVGVGDMGGDVFGNGMLQSEKIRLVGAFNHVHIFCDPSPDAAISFKERDRLFKAVKGWDCYDVSKLSKGGRIYARSEKYLKLTPEIQQRFEIEKDTVSPSELMIAMLKSRSDLLFFGGIGTYVKASTETDADAGDRSNDAQRINASDVRAKVIGEGANMAITQRGRIEFAQKGGKANTDFIDNSAGVDTSDHEVNIKILMSDIMANPKQKMNIAARDKLLATMTDDVARLVLNDNYQQTQAISLLEAQAADLLPEHAAFMNSLEKAKLLNRRVEFLPDAEQIEQRLKLRKGLTRPELSLIISYGKITYTDALLQSKLPDDPTMIDWLMAYFPESLQKKYPDAIGKHQLRREIIATAIANAVINRMGPTFVRLAQEKTGKDLGSITNAYLVVRDAFGLRDLWKSIEALDSKVPALAQTRAMQKISKLAERETYWLLNRLGRTANLEKDGAVFSKGISDLKLTLEKILPPDMKENFVVR
ncbi:MAG: NAD-glutamate dehydrogenase domain-containing protein, partial [Pseudomonadota bacterium]